MASPKRNFESLALEEEKRLSNVHPTHRDIPSCTTLFFDALNCIGVANQIRSVYRYGTAAQCDNKWDDSKFCFKNKLLGREEYYAAWIRHRAEWWASRRLGRSSEDVWDLRREDEPLPPPSSSVAGN